MAVTWIGGIFTSFVQALELQKTHEHFFRKNIEIAVLGHEMFFLGKMECIFVLVLKPVQPNEIPPVHVTARLKITVNSPCQL